MAAAFRADGSILNEAAFDKFFELPIRRFQASQASMDSNERDFVVGVLSLTLFVSIADLIEVRRATSADEYNGLNNRRQRAMRSIPDDDLACIQLGERLLAMLRGLPTNDPDHVDRVKRLEEGIAPFKQETLRLRGQF